MKTYVFIVISVLALLISCSGSVPNPNVPPKVLFAGFVRDEDRAIPSSQYNCRNISQISDDSLSSQSDYEWFMIGSAVQPGGALPDSTVKKIACDSTYEKPDGYKRTTASRVEFYVKRKPF